jgi:chemotaxis protein histidine kinase CheA
MGTCRSLILGHYARAPVSQPHLAPYQHTMSTPLGSADFFALEAGECLDRLENLVSQSGSPPADELLRNARVLRGSALMAAQTQIARAAAGLESVARAYRENKRSWDAATREQVAQSVEEFRLLVRQSTSWTEADTARAVRLGRALESLAGRPSPELAPEPATEPNRPELHTGVRAFVAREGALIASALDRAARSLRVSPGDREPLYNVIRRMQSLRGLAELGDLSPLPEILDGIELAVGDLTRLFAPPPDVDKVMECAGQALTRIARDVAERGRPDPDAEEARRFTELLLRAFAVERDVVPIESLYYAGDPNPLTQPVSQPQFTPAEPLGPLELVSQGEHLSQTATLIASAASATQRDLRLYHLLGVLRSAATPSPDPVAAGLVIFARSAQEALAAGVASHSVTQLAAHLQEAGELLRSVGESDDRMLISRRLLDVAYRLDGLRAAEPSALTEAVVVPISSLEYDNERDVVPIESLAPDAPSMADPLPGIEASFRTFDLLIRERGPVPSSLERLLGIPAASSQAARTAIPAAVPAIEEEPEPVAIRTLVYHGQAALERAVTVRHQIAAELSRKATLESLQPLLQELLDLVPLALEQS